MASRNSKNESLGFGCLSLFGIAFLVSMCTPDREDSPEDQNDITTSEDIKSLLADKQDRNAKNDEHKTEDVETYEDELYVTANILNARSSPKAQSPVIKKISYGQRVRVVGKKGDWLKIKEGASSFWIASLYTSRSRPKPKVRPKPRYYNNSCPCRGNNVCIGPRGGRYCITSGGNKRYGV